MSEHTPHEDAATVPLSPEALGAAPGPRSVLLKVLSAALSGGLIVLLFGVLIPTLSGMGEVWDAIAGMSPATVVGLVLIALLIRLLLWIAFAVIVPGLSLFRSAISKEAATAVSNIVPGPSGTAAQYVILRSWGVSTERFAGATVTIGVLSNALILVAPGLFWLVWVLLGMPALGRSEWVWLVGLVAITVSVVTILLVSAVFGSEHLAARVGRVAQRLVNPLRKLFKKPAMTTWPDQVVELRSSTLAELELHRVSLLGCVFAGYLANGVLLVASMYACGVSEKDLPVSLGLTLYSIGRLCLIVPITPGGVGVAEVVYTTIYVAVLGEAAKNEVIAGVLVFRALTYALPLITGAVSYVIWRVLRFRERHEAQEAAAGA
ncbi:lysylphosphatidylglycerol synthase transmembrane domain-containing protein [Marmoricola sp. RAF53]|uniref:lysylphosphatidylglycerol synthase transmembrane domain-containing protein n=1 Tax=Marmoricola sp. RAF53 TaxID=3233059 RepID=UPI003F98FCF8